MKSFLRYGLMAACLLFGGSSSAVTVEDVKEVYRSLVSMVARFQSEVPGIARGVAALARRDAAYYRSAGPTSCDEKVIATWLLCAQVRGARDDPFRALADGLYAFSEAECNDIARELQGIEDEMANVYGVALSDSDDLNEIITTQFEALNRAVKPK